MIVVRIPDAVYAREVNEINANMTLLVTLRKAGIPTVGNISLRGVAHGCITIAHESGEHVFTWVPDDDL